MPHKRLKNYGSREAELRFFLSLFSTSPFQEPYESCSCHVNLPNPTDFTPDIIAAAKEGLKRIYRLGYAYKKAGVLLADLSDGAAIQLDSLTPEPNREKKVNAMRALDQINSRFSKRAVRFAAEGVDPEWRSLPTNVSPKYTTSWCELLTVKS